MSAATEPVQAQSPRRERIPPLENGDHLTADEFRRRYEAMPEHVRAELIGGIVFMSSPVRHRLHAKPHMELSGWLTYYIARTPGLELYGDNGTVRLQDDAEPQPDLMLALPSAIGGRAVEDKDGYIVGPPELVCEVASSSAGIDLGRKMRDYRRNRVREYLVWAVDDGRIDWFDLLDGEYIAKSVNESGFLTSSVFPGLWLDPTKLPAGDLRGLFADLDRGTHDPRHAAFVKRLTEAKPAT